MELGKATAIFLNINSDKYTEIEKGEAIKIVLEMPTHNGISKNKILEVTKWLFDLCFEEIKE